MNDRYSRQILFSPIGKQGQQSIGEKHVLVVGVGALGSSVSEMLTRAGVGKLTLIDRDYVETSNLQRQQLFSERDAKEKLPKVIAAKKRLADINREVKIEAIVGEADVQTLENFAPKIDLMIDGTDNFDIRFILNDIAHKFTVPFLFGSCVGSFGSTYTIIPNQTPCLQCLLKNIPMQGQTCDTVGIIAPTVQMVTAYQVAEALKILSGKMDAIRKTYITFDLWENQHLSVKSNDAIKNKACTTCGEERTYPFLSYEAQTKTALLCGRNTVQIRPSQTFSPSIGQLCSRWELAGYQVKQNPYLVSVHKDDVRMIMFKDGRALIHGTNDPVKAKKIYYSFIG